jgi:hypothetical protein
MYVGLMTGKTEDQDGSWWVNTPRAMANAGVSLPLTSQWQAAIDTQWLGERRTDEYAWQFDGIDTYSKVRTGAGELDAQWTGNLILTWGKHLPDTTVSVGIYNLANSTNYNPAWPQHAQNRIPLPARSTLVKIDHRFD